MAELPPDGQHRRELRLRQIQAGHRDCDQYGPAIYDVEQGPVCSCGALLDEDRAPLVAAGQQEAAQLAETVGVDEFAAAQQQQSELIQSGLDVVKRHSDTIGAGLALIDPTLPYGPKEIEEHILDAVTRLERGIAAEAGLIVAQHEAEMNYALAFARAMSVAQASNAPKQKAEAELACEKEFRRMVLVRQVCAAMRATTHSLRSVLSGYQSVAKSVTAAYGETNRQAAHAEGRIR